MPGDLAAPVDVDDGGAVGRALVGLRALARRVDRARIRRAAGLLQQGLVEHRRAEKLYALTPKGEARIR